MVRLVNISTMIPVVSVVVDDPNAPAAGPGLPGL